MKNCVIKWCQKLCIFFQVTFGFGELENLTTNHKLDQWALLFCLFQSHLETVVPAPDRSVLVLMGKHRGEEAVLKSLDVEKFCAKLKLVETGEKISLPYEHFSKLHSA